MRILEKKEVYKLFYQNKLNGCYKLYPDETEAECMDVSLDEINKHFDNGGTFGIEYFNTYEAYEDNGGGLHLVILQNGECTHYFTNFEYNPGSLKQAIADLKNGSNPDTWDGAWENPQKLYDDIANDCTADLIADNDGIYLERMGGSACLDFGIIEE